MQADYGIADKGLTAALVFDGEGGARPLSWDEIVAWQPAQGLLWLHFDYTHPFAHDWLLQDSGLEEVIAEALVMEESRPRITRVEDGLLVALRGVNLNPGADPEDMVAIRLWMESGRIVSTRKRRLISIDELLQTFTRRQGPVDAGEFLIELIRRLTWRVGEIIEQTEEDASDLEEEVLQGKTSELRTDLADLRRQSIALRRYLAPQREALNRLQGEGERVSWINADQSLELREVTDQLVREIEDLDAVRERAAVTGEELNSRISDQLNQRMYLLSLVAAIFLPLGFFTGLLGINVGGVPGMDNPLAFWIFSGLLTTVVGFQLWWFYRKGWF